MYTAFTRAIQRRYGHREVPRVCPECGLTQPRLDSFPSSNILGLGALVWATSNRRPRPSGVLHCPRCGAAMTMTEELERRKRRRDEPK